MFKTPIFLIGFMASAKTTIGKKLADKLEYEFIDLDEYIEEKERETISQIFKLKGETYFREIESKALEEVVDKSAVIALGGGTAVKYDNRVLLRNGQSVFLDVSPHVLIRRLAKDKKRRPLIADLSYMELTDYVKRNLEQRRPYYEEADVIIKSNKPTLKEIISKLSKK